MAAAHISWENLTKVFKSGCSACAVNHHAFLPKSNHNGKAPVPFLIHAQSAADNRAFVHM